MNRLPLIVACVLIGWNAHRAYVRHQAAYAVDDDAPIVMEIEPAPWYVERVVRDMAYRTRWDC